MMKVTFGSTYRDVITGFQGVATGTAHYITGCDQALLSRPVDAGGDRKAEWIDIGRLECVDSIALVTLPGHAREYTGADIPAPNRY